MKNKLLRRRNDLDKVFEVEIRVLNRYIDIFHTFRTFGQLTDILMELADNLQDNYFVFKMKNKIEECESLIRMFEKNNIGNAAIDKTFDKLKSVLTYISKRIEIEKKLEKQVSLLENLEENKNYIIKQIEAVEIAEEKEEIKEEVEVLKPKRKRKEYTKYVSIFTQQED